MNIRRRWLVVASTCFLTSCETVVDHKGFQLEHARMDEVAVHKDNLDSVREKIGSPTVELPYPDEQGRTVWYYVSRKVQDGTFSLPSVVEQKTYVLRFDQSGVLRDMSESDKHASVGMSREITESSTYESGMMRDVFGSFGRNLSKKSSS